MTRRSRRLRPEIGIGAAVILGLSFLALPFLPLPDPPLAGWGAFVGRLHPLVVHFPIVLVLVPLLLEAAARVGRERVFLKLVPIFWGLAAVSCMVAVIAGFLLYASGEYTGELIRQHLWAGIVLVLLVLTTAILSIYPAVRASRRWFAGYLACAVLANAVVVYAGHLGGSLTHGEGFLADAFPGWTYQAAAIETLPREELLVFQHLVTPALQARCTTCHNPQNRKGSLDLTSLRAMERGGDSGRPMIVAGRPDSSELYRRVTLPPGHDDRMPPEGRAGLSSDEIALLAWWIEEGADPEMRLGDGPPDLLRRALVDRYLPRLVLLQRRRIRERRRLEALHRELQKVAERNDLVVAPDPETDSTRFAVSMRFPPGRVDDGTLARLADYAEAFSKLSLVSSDVTDEGLRHVGRMLNLRELILQKTRIDGSGLEHLQSLPALEILNLSHTAVDDQGAVHLLRIPSLQEVYLYNTAVSDTMLEALQTHLPDARILNVEGAAY